MTVGKKAYELAINSIEIHFAAFNYSHHCFLLTKLAEDLIVYVKSL